MFFGLKRKNKLCLNINGQLITQSEHVKLLGVTIDNALKFDTHVHRISKKANQILHAFGRLRLHLGNEKLKLLLNAVGLSNFSYCLLIWLFCSKTVNTDINRTHKHPMRILHRDYESTFVLCMYSKGPVIRQTRRIQTNKSFLFLNQIQ